MEQAKIPDSQTVDRGVGATAERKLQQIEPLVEYYDREMGVFAGRLMLAASLLRDARAMKDVPEEVGAAIELGEALAVSVMTRILAAGEDGCDCDCVADEVQALLDRQGGPA